MQSADTAPLTHAALEAVIVHLQSVLAELPPHDGRRGGVLHAMRKARAQQLRLEVSHA